MSEQMMTTAPRAVTEEERPFWETVARLYREYGMEDETVTDNSVLTEAIDRTHADAFSALHRFMDAIVAYEAATGNSPLDGTQYERVFGQDMESALFAFADIIAERYDEGR